jgi:peptide/nickel transport system substrate-binding protein
MNSKRALGRLFVTGATALMLVAGFSVHSAAAAPAQQGGSRNFPETKQTVSGRFLEVWNSVAPDDATRIFINGYPITDAHQEQSLENGQVYTMQWFERARFEAHPENKAPYDVLLGRLGAFTAEGRTDAPFQAVNNPNNGTQWYPETKHTVGDTSTGGKSIASFWAKYGGIAQFGFPLSQPFMEVTKETDPKVAGKAFLVQYFERQRFEYHPENAGTAFEVLLGRLGAEQMNQVPTIEATLTGRTNPVDTIKVARTQDPDTLVPFSANTLVGVNIQNAVFNGAVKQDNNGNYVPDLAYYVPTLDNGGAYYVGSGDDQRFVVKYKLKQGIKWYDGQVENSNDWVFTYKMVLDPSFSASGRSAFQRIQSVQNPDPYTVIVNYLTWKEASALIQRDKTTYGFLQSYVDAKKPVTDPLFQTAFAIIVPSHLLQNTDLSQIGSSDWALKPWGTGPYYVSDNESGQFIQMKINPNYNVTPNKPVIQTIYSPLLTDVKQVPTEIQTGDIDMATGEDLTPDQLPTLDAVQTAGKGKVLVSQTLGYEHIDFATNRAPFNDLRVRQAFRYALDFDAINKANFGGGLPFLTQSWIPCTNWASICNATNSKAYPDIAKQLPTYSFDVAKANQLLDAAGWTMGSDGIRVKDGKQFHITYTTTTSKPYRIKNAQIVPQMLKAVGILADGNPEKSSILFADPPDGPLYTGSYGDFGVAEFAWSNGTDEPGAVGLFASSSIPNDANQHSGSNDLFWSNPDNDKFSSVADGDIGHGKARLEAYLNQQVVFMQQLPSIPLFALPNIVIIGNGVQNVTTWQGTYNDYQNLYKSK